jgi:hypothetical protein
MSAPMICRVGEAVPPAAVPTRRDRAALRARPLLARLAAVANDALYAVVLDAWLVPLTAALAELTGKPAVSSPTAPRHRLPDVLPVTFAADLAAHGFSLPAYLDRTVPR